jgi:thiamine monophosphate kinase
MDISDGLGASLAQMAAMTGLSYVVEWDKVPVYRDAASLALPIRKDLVLYSGGDYELVATVKPEAVEALAEQLKNPNRQRRSTLAVIGHVEKNGSNHLMTSEGREPLLGKGWEHFRPSHVG